MRRHLPLLGLVLFGCASPTSPGAPAGSNVASEDERGNVGVPPPAVEYCKSLGYTLVGEQCQLPDGTSCEQWSFYRGACGQAHSYCNRHGGQISTVERDAGTSTAVVAVCDLDGKRCEEDTFWRSGKCE
ncbi:MAG TPA: DUF333 domain-containing protein [Gaiellaceae bacterium]|nr:DUF333 domain-containing protein [Gaiellaceae bacterium]